MDLCDAVHEAVGMFCTDLQDYAAHLERSATGTDEQDAEDRGYGQACADTAQRLRWLLELCPPHAAPDDLADTHARLVILPGAAQMRTERNGAP